MTNKSARSTALATGLALAVVICISPGGAHAQSGSLIVNIPFDFYIGSVKLPAGQYKAVPATDPAILRIYDGNGHAALTMTYGVNNRSTSRDGEMMFNRYGDQYFLSEVRWTQYSAARQLIKSRAEIELAKNVAPERVVTAKNNK